MTRLHLHRCDALPGLHDAAADHPAAPTAQGAEHRATFRQGQTADTWDGGCTICGVAFYGETDRLRADAWCNGHNSAVARMAAAPVPLWFPPVGPGDAITLAEMINLLTQVGGRFGFTSEIVQPAAYPPLLFVWTPPAQDGWDRARIGAVVVERGGAFIPEPDIP